MINSYPASICLFKLKNGYMKTLHKNCSKLTKKIPGQHQWSRPGGFTVNFEQMYYSDISIADFEQVNISWVSFNTSAYG